MDIPVRHECTVSGVLGFVLRISRVYGVAALKYQRLENGWRIRKSLVASVYGVMLVLTLCTLTWIHLITDFTKDKEHSLQTRTGSDTFVNMSSAFLISSVVLVKAYLGTKGAQQLITCLAQLNKINIELNHYRAARLTNKYQWLFVVWALVGAHATVIIDGFLYFEEVHNRNSGCLYESMYVAYYLLFIQVKVIVIQICLVFMDVLSSFNHLNDCLAEALQQIRNSTTTIDSKKYSIKRKNVSFKYFNNVIDTIALNEEDESSITISSKIHHLGSLYNSLCEVVQHADACHEILLIPLLVSFLLHLVMTPYNLITKLFGDEVDIYRSVVQVLWAAYHITDLLAIVEPCHQTHEQIKCTKRLISRLMRATPEEERALITELELFYKHLTLNEVFYAPMKMFKLSRNMLTTVVGSITTYLIVVIQM